MINHRNTILIFVYLYYALVILSHSNTWSIDFYILFSGSTTCQAPE